MSINFPHYIFHSESGMIILKFPEEKGRILFALRTDLNKLHFWLAHSKAGTIVDLNESGKHQLFIAVLYQYEGGQYSKIYKPDFSKEEDGFILFECSPTDLTIAKEEFEKTYINRLIIEMAADYAALRQAFLEASAEVVKQSKIVTDVKPKLIVN